MNGTKEQSLEGRRIAGGVASRVWFEKFFGLNRTEAVVTAAAWIVDHVEFTVRTRVGTELIFVLERAGGEKVLYSTPHLTLWCRSNQVPPKLLRSVHFAAKARLHLFTISHIESVLRKDPELGKFGEPMPQLGVRRIAYHHSTWGAEGVWADFFARGEIEREVEQCKVESSDFINLFRTIHHCDRECYEVVPQFEIIPLPRMIDYPKFKPFESRPMCSYGDRANAVHANESQPPSWKTILDSCLTSGLTEIDVITGNSEKLRTAIDKAVSTHDPQARPLYCINTCVPIVAGEDVRSVLSEFQDKSPLPVVCYTSKGTNIDPFDDLLVRRRLEAEQMAPPPDSAAVNLIGFEPCQGTRELVALLGTLGVRVQTEIIPSLDHERIARLPGAALNVFRPNHLWEHYYSQLREGTRTQSIALPTPIGPTSTIHWLSELLERLGISAKSGAIESATQQAIEQWNAAKAHAKGAHLGFVIRGEELSILLDPSASWGIPLLQFAREAGFGVDMFVHSSDSRASAMHAEFLVKAVEPGPSWSLRVVHTFEALTEQLSASPCQAVFSHHFYDWRLSQCGKARVAASQFEIGIAGGARTIRRLAGVCANPFYRKYAKHLKRDPAGLRVLDTMQ